MSTDSKLLTVEIYGQTYQLRGEGEEERIRELSDFLDEQMNEIAEQTSEVDSLDIAVLAALNIADSYFTLRESDETGEIPEGKINNLIEMLDDCLEDNEGET